MTMPREILPGATSLLSRRTSERRFFLRPDPRVTQAFFYCLAYAATIFGIDVHALVALSDHIHVVATDPFGVLPDFMQCLDLLVAKTVNAYRGRWECMWAPGSYSAVRLETPEDVLAKIVYVLANPVKAGLVSHAKDWTGATSVRWKFGETRTFERPVGFFDVDGTMPEKVALTLAPPPGFDDRTNEELDRLVLEQLRAEETRIRAERRAEGRPFLGMDGVMRFDPNDRPNTREPRREMNPRIAAADVDVRVEAIRARQDFLDEYRKAYCAWAAGNHDVVFPAGTWLMRVRHAAHCQPSPAPS
jgi:hypothetical protein